MSKEKNTKAKKFGGEKKEKEEKSEGKKGKARECIHGASRVGWPGAASNGRGGQEVAPGTLA